MDQHCFLITAPQQTHVHRHMPMKVVYDRCLSTVDLHRLLCLSKIGWCICDRLGKLSSTVFDRLRTHVRARHDTLTTLRPHRCVRFRRHTSVLCRRLVFERAHWRHSRAGNEQDRCGLLGRLPLEVWTHQFLDLRHFSANNRLPREIHHNKLTLAPFLGFPRFAR